MGLAVNLTQPGFSTQKASADDIAETKAARAQLSGLRSQICSVKNTITGLTQMLEADKAGCTTPHKFGWKEAFMNIVQSNYFGDPKDRLATERFELFQANEHLDTLQKEVEPLEEADLIFKTNEAIVKKEARLAQFEKKANPTRDDRKRIDALRGQLDDLRTNRDTLLIKHAARAMHMHGQAAMPLEQVLQSLDLTIPARTLCNIGDWITTPHLAPGGPGPFVLQGAETGNTTSLDPDASLSRVPNGTSSNVDSGPRQLQLPLRAVGGEQLTQLPADIIGNQAPAGPPPTANEKDSAVYQSIKLEREQRATTDARIDALNFELTKKNPNCSDHAAILPLVTQLTGWPDTLKINIINTKGQLQASYLTGNDDRRITKTIFLTPTPNGYVLQGRNKQQPLFRLLAEQVSAASKLAKDSFQDSNSRQGIAETIRQQTASLAKQRRPALFVALGKNAGSVKTDPKVSSSSDAGFLPYWNNHEAPYVSRDLTKLQEYFPALQLEQLSVLLEHTPLSSLELRDLYVHSALPDSIYNAAAELEQRVRLDRAKDGISNQRPYSSDTDLLAREVLKQQLNRQLDKTLTILEPGQRFEASSGTTSSVVLSHLGGGHYEALDLNNGGTIPTDNTPDSLFLAVSTALQPHERLKLGAKWENDISGLRSHMATVAEPLDATSLFANTSPRPERSIPKRDFSAGLVSGGPSVVLENAKGQNDHLKGVGRLNVQGGGICSATLLDTRTLGAGYSSPGYLMTAAHCVGTPEGTVETNRRAPGLIVFNFFKDTQHSYRAFQTTAIPYSSFNRTDIAIVEIEASVQYLIGRGITPFAFASQRPVNGTQTVVVGAPVFEHQTVVNVDSTTGFDKSNFLRAAACDNFLATPNLVYGKAYDLKNEYRNQCLDVTGGSSGGPVLTRDGRVLAVMSNQEYEVDETQQVRTKWLGNIARPVDHLRDCFADGEFNAANPGCEPDLFDSTFKQLGADVAAHNRERNKKTTTTQTPL